jgi:hypothetical protein
MDLNFTPGDPSANSFADLTQYKEFILDRVPLILPAKTTYEQLVTLFASTSLDEKLKRSLVSATSMLCRFIKWNGTIYDPDQALCFGRTGLYDLEGRVVEPSTHPSQIINASFELSWKLYNGLELVKENVVAQLGVRGVKAGSLAVDFYESDTTGVENSEINTLPELLYLKLPSSVLAYIPPSWYERGSLIDLRKKRPMFFTA